MLLTQNMLPNFSPHTLAVLLALDDTPTHASLIAPYGGFTLARDYSPAFTLATRMRLIDTTANRSKCVFEDGSGRTGPRYLHNAVTCPQGQSKRPFSQSRDQEGCPAPETVSDFGPIPITITTECFTSPCLETEADFVVKAVGMSDKVLKLSGLYTDNVIGANRSVVCTRDVSAKCLWVDSRLDLQLIKPPEAYPFESHETAIPPFTQHRPNAWPLSSSRIPSRL